MYKRFDFEGDIHASLSCVPLTVRRKLDLAGLKISLEGWQRLSREERLALCHLPVDADAEIEVYREVMRGFCQQRGVACKPLDDAMARTRAWNSANVPAGLHERAADLGATLNDPAWGNLDEESRYALVKLADPKRTPEKLQAALVELGLLAGPAPAVDPGAAICGAPGPSRG
jgi:hypothetical protein